MSQLLLHRRLDEGRIEAARTVTAFAAGLAMARP
jgi:hypothetical protein